MELRFLQQYFSNSFFCCIDIAGEDVGSNCKHKHSLGQIGRKEWGVEARWATFYRERTPHKSVKTRSLRASAGLPVAIATACAAWRRPAWTEGWRVDGNSDAAAASTMRPLHVAECQLFLQGSRWLPQLAHSQSVSHLDLQ